MNRNQTSFLNIDVWLNRYHNIDMNDPVINALADNLLAEGLCVRKKVTKRTLQITSKGIEYWEDLNAPAQTTVASENSLSQLKGLPIKDKIVLGCTIITVIINSITITWEIIITLLKL
ncbi:MAG: hypothetical protein RL007_958 [Bacteroidota bacterium]